MRMAYSNKTTINLMCQLLNQTSLEETWDDLGHGVKQIFLHKHKNLSKARYMELYTQVYNYCTGQIAARSTPESHISPLSKFFANELREKVKAFLQSYLIDLSKQGVGLLDEAVLRFYARQWEEHRFCSRVFNGIFSYLNKLKQVFECRKEVIPEIYQLSLRYWRDFLFLPLHKQLTSAILKIIEKERRGENFHTPYVRDLLNSYVEISVDEEDCNVESQNLCLYKEKFENVFLLETKRFYVIESMDLMRKIPFSEYMKKVEQRLQEEEKRAQLYLHKTTFNTVVEACEDILIQKYLEVFYSEFRNLMRNDKVDDLRRMFRLLARLKDGLQNLWMQLETHIHHEGLSVIEMCAKKALHNPIIYIDAILKIYRKYSALVKAAFHNEAGFVAAIDKACKKFVNNNAVTRLANSSNKSPELLAKYCDLFLKKESKRLKETELDETLNQIMLIFSYLDDKDVFQQFYRKKLANRLIQQSSFNDDAEVILIAKFREACGFEYTSKLHRMFQDIAVSKDLNEQFRMHVKDSNESLDLDFSIQILSSVLWPFRRPSAFALPQELERSVQRFTIFFTGLHSGRKLLWFYSISKGEIVTNCFKKRYILQVSTFQMSVLLQFNNDDAFTIQQLQEITQIRIDILKQVVQILLKSKLLISEDDENDLQLSSWVLLHFEYRNKKLRININAPLKAEVKAEEEVTYKHIEDDRKLLIQAAIVRIMKMKKVLKHQPLLTEVFNQLASRFKPSVQTIKKCIDILIEKEYLDRVDEKTYKYLV